MSKQVLLDQTVLEFRGASSSPDGITQALEEKLGQVDWTELLKPVLQRIPAKIRVVDASGRRRSAKKPAKTTRRSRKRGKFSVVITRIGYSTKAFEISGVTSEEAERIALEQASNHEFTEKTSEYEVQSVSQRA